MTVTNPLPGPKESIVAGTGAGGFALQNGTPTLFSWTAPNDGQMHPFIIQGIQTGVTAQTGGGVSVSYRAGGSAQGGTLWGGGLAGPALAASFPAAADPGTTVTVQQTAALTAGTGTVYASMIAGQ